MLRNKFLPLFLIPFWLVFPLFGAPDSRLKDLISEEKIAFFGTVEEKLKIEIKKLTKNEQACLLNLFAGQFEILQYATSLESDVNQEQLITTLQSFKKVLDDFEEKQCNEGVLTIFNELQKSIAEITPEDLIKKIQKIEEEANKLMSKANSKSKDIEKVTQELQEEYMKAMVEMQSIHMEASLRIYTILYETIKSINPQSLLKRYDVTGLIPLTKRKKNVIAPVDVEKMIALFLDASQAAV